MRLLAIEDKLEGFPLTEITTMTLIRRYLSVVLTLLLYLSFLPSRPLAQNSVGESSTTETADKAALHQALLDLTNPWTVMCVAAHPDDEDGSTLTVLRRKFGVHTVSLFSTYGEGGQNAIGPELYEQLGVIRARETIAAAEVQGSEPHFLGFKDFGFSKSAEETFRAWGENEILRRMVFQLRLLRPDIIITNHDTTSGHGHHQATGRMILQAFAAAADPNEFPEQLNQVTVWQPKRLFVRVFRRQDNNSPSTNDDKLPSITIDPNEKDPIRGTTYAEQALQALQKHATQGPWPKTVPPNGARVIRYSLVRTASSAPPLPANAKSFLDGLSFPEAIATHLVAPTLDNKPLVDSVEKRGEVLVSLINARKHGAFAAPREVVGLDPQRFRLMSTRLDRALATAAELSLSLRTSEPVLVPGIESKLNVTLTNAGDAEVAIRNIAFRGLALDRRVDSAEKLLPATDTTQEVVIATPKNENITVPAAQHLYDGRLFGEPLDVEATMEIAGAPFVITGEQRVDVAPAVEITNNNPSPCVETPATALSCLDVSLNLSNNLRSSFKGLLELSTPFKGGRAHVTHSEVALNPGETRKVLPATAKISAREITNFKATNEPIKVLLTTNSKEPVAEATFPVVSVAAVAVAGLNVGYLPSSDPTLKNSLAALGLQATELSIDKIAKDDLSSFDSIVIDNRGYEAHPELIAINDRLLKFAEQGGTLIVFYHKTNEWNPDPNRQRPQLAPYPIILSDDRVTDENAPVRFLLHRHPLFNFPNRITQRDFDGWIQERGLYFPKEWDSHYAALLSTNDPGEKPLTGGLLVAPYGQGNYIYTSMVWYRQLRGGIPGGYRMFANMISYGHTRTRKG
ncbi:MAG: PIG-L deacetylase family protein [Pyrinomonadaceae bacterium]